MELLGVDPAGGATNPGGYVRKPNAGLRQRPLSELNVSFVKKMLMLKDKYPWL